MNGGVNMNRIATGDRFYYCATFSVGTTPQDGDGFIMVKSTTNNDQAAQDWMHECKGAVQNEKPFTQRYVSLPTNARKGYSGILRNDQRFDQTERYCKYKVASDNSSITIHKFDCRNNTIEPIAQKIVKVANQCNCDCSVNETEHTIDYIPDFPRGPNAIIPRHADTRDCTVVCDQAAHSLQCPSPVTNDDDYDYVIDGPGKCSLHCTSPSFVLPIDCSATQCPDAKYQISAGDCDPFRKSLGLCSEVNAEDYKANGICDFDCRAFG